MAGDWSVDEVRRTVEDYFGMLRLELRGEPYNKTEHRTQLLKRLSQRSPSAVEKKHQNISAILGLFGWPAIDGYKPLGNYQRLLGEEVVEYLDRDPATLALIEETAATLPDRAPEPFGRIDNVVVEPPDPLPARAGVNSVGRLRTPRRINFDLLDATNRRLGRLGEKFAFEFERLRLARAGRDDLARQVDWVSDSKGDGAALISSHSTRRALIVTLRSRRQITACGFRFSFRRTKSTFLAKRVTCIRYTGSSTFRGSRGSTHWMARSGLE
jgi:hypothetical protein